MYAITTIFHLLSIVCLVAVLWQWSRYKQLWRFERLLWRSLAKSNVTLVDTPEAFLMKFSQVIGFDLEKEGAFLRTPVKINLKSWLRVYQEFDICRIVLNQPEENSFEVLVYVAKPMRNEAEIVQLLTKSFGKELSLKVSVRVA